MTVAANYAPVTGSSASASIRVDISWPWFPGGLRVYLKKADGTVLSSVLAPPLRCTFTEHHDETGDYVLIANGTGEMVDYIVARYTTATQEYNPSEAQRLNPVALMAAMDKAMFCVQENAANFELFGVQAFDPYTIPPSGGRKSGWLGFDSSGNSVFISNSDYYNKAQVDALIAAVNSTISGLTGYNLGTDLARMTIAEKQAAGVAPLAGGIVPTVNIDPYLMYYSVQFQMTLDTVGYAGAKPKITLGAGSANIYAEIFWGDSNTSYHTLGVSPVECQKGEAYDSEGHYVVTVLLRAPVTTEFPYALDKLVNYVAVTDTTTAACMTAVHSVIGTVTELHLDAATGALASMPSIIARLTELTDITVNNSTALTPTHMDSLFAQLRTITPAGNSGRTCVATGNQPPTAAGLADVAWLRENGWTVTILPYAS